MLRDKDVHLTPIELWSHFSRKKHRYNRLDLGSESDSDSSLEETRPPPKKDKEGNIQLVLTKDDWKKFWVNRLRKRVDAPNLTDKDITDIVERHKRIYLQKRDEPVVVSKDPDLPLSYYWNKYQVAEWTTSVGLPDIVKDMLLNSEICGRHLITVDANSLVKMGLYDLSIIKMVSRAVRQILNLPPTNGMRALGRLVPLEMFLRSKVRTGGETDQLTFKQFCENEGIDYEGAIQQIADGYKYKVIGDTCKVIIKPQNMQDVKWIPISMYKPKHSNQDQDESVYVIRSSEDDESTSSSNSDSDLRMIPTVEQIANSVQLRSTLIPEILNDIVNNVFKAVSENEKAKNSQELKEIAELITQNRLQQAYNDLHLGNSEDKLKLVTIIAEELVGDILRARDILEDIDKFQKRIKLDMSETEMHWYQAAVANYVQEIMPLVVSASLQEIHENTNGVVEEETAENDELQLNRADSVATLFHRGKQLDP